MQMPSLNSIPCWYVIASILLSLYQGYRGFRFQWLLGVKSIENKYDKVSLLCIADMLTYFFCALSGFYALFILYWAANQVEPLNPAIAIFLVLYGLVGVTGKLPELLATLKLPGA